MHEDRGHGHYSFVDGVISDIILTDIDGNGIADMSFSCSSKGKWVILFQKDKSFIKREIKRAVVVAVGGC